MTERILTPHHALLLRCAKQITELVSIRHDTAYRTSETSGAILDAIRDALKAQPSETKAISQLKTMQADLDRATGRSDDKSQPQSAGLKCCMDGKPIRVDPCASCPQNPHQEFRAWLDTYGHKLDYDRGDMAACWYAGKRAAVSATAATMPGDDEAGSYVAGWNDALERSRPKVQKLKRGEASWQYVNGFNECLDSLSASTDGGGA